MGKKIKIITIHDLDNNFGSTLQACALAEFLSQNGYDAELIDYKPNYAHHYGRAGQLIKFVLFHKNMRQQKIKFEEYFNQHAKRTRRYSNYGELIKDKAADIYLVGSDQVWNEFYNAGKDPAYYLEFTSSTKKMAFSASLGQIHTEEELERVKDKVNGFYAIGLRERASVDQLHSIGMTNVTHVLDPVFLYEKNYYIDPHFHNKYGKYLLVYSVNNDLLMEKTAVFMAKKNNLKIILVGGFVQKTKHDYYLRGIGPSDFTNLINNAQYVVTNSFHAMAISIILNKQFSVVMPKYSSLRLTDLLQTIGIEKRMILSDEEIEEAHQLIDYDNVNMKVQELREESIDFLLTNIRKLGFEYSNATNIN